MLAVTSCNDEPVSIQSHSLFGSRIWHRRHEIKKYWPTAQFRACLAASRQRDKGRVLGHTSSVGWIFRLSSVTPRHPTPTSQVTVTGHTSGAAIPNSVGSTDARAISSPPSSACWSSSFGGVDDVPAGCRRRRSLYIFTRDCRGTASSGDCACDEVVARGHQGPPLADARVPDHPSAILSLPERTTPRPVGLLVSDISIGT